MVDPYDEAPRPEDVPVSPAATVMLVIPILIVYFFFQRWIVVCATPCRPTPCTG